MIKKDVYNYLKSRTNEAAEIHKELNAVEAEIKAGRWEMTTKALNALYEKRFNLQHELNKLVENATIEAKRLVSEYQEKMYAADSLNPAEITEDVKLLTSGIPLMERDIKAIITRNSGNGTMIQLALRYARENNIDVGLEYIGNEQKISDAEVVNTVIDYYTSKWMQRDNAAEMLDKFFEAIE